MSIQFIIGGAGSGKTTLAVQEMIKESLKEQAGSCVILVPEQYSMQMETEVVKLHPRHGTFGIQVCSFPRFAMRCFEEAGKPLPVLMDDTGKSLLLRKVAYEKEKDLTIFRKNISRPGFIDECKSMLSELWQYRIGSEELKSWSEKATGRPAFQAKCRDLKTLSEGFHAALQENTLPAEELLEASCPYIENSPSVKGACILLDGFTGFTPTQLTVLERILPKAAKVTVTLTLQSGRKMSEIQEKEDLFSLTKSTYVRLCRLAENCGVQILPDRMLFGEKGRFFHSQTLSRLEGSFDRAFLPEDKVSAGDSVSIHICRDPADESEFAAEEICRMVREEGYRYREIAVLLGDMAAYEKPLVRAFKRRGIPLFYDSSRTLMENPLPMLICNLLEIFDGNYAYEDVFDGLKSVFSPLSENERDRLENICLRDGIRGRKAFEEAWEASADLLAAKEKALRPVFQLQDTLKEAGYTGTSYKEGITEFLKECQAEEVLQTLCDQFHEQGEFSLEREYRQSLELTLRLLTQVEAVLGDAKILPAEMKELLRIGFTKIKAGVIPAGLDEVTAGDLKRTRLSEERCVFILGMNEGVIPSEAQEGGIFSEIDREWLAAQGAELKATEKENSFIQKFYVYLALTRPSERLILCAGRRTEKGEEKALSGILREIRKILPGVDFIDETDREEKPDSHYEALLSCGGGLREYVRKGSEGDWQKLWRFLKEEGKDAPAMEQMLEKAFIGEKGESIGSQAAALLFGEGFTGSVTTLERYAACAYSWFLQDGLQLTERKLHTFEARDMGEVFHSALELFLKKMKKEKLGWGDISEKMQSDFADECLDETLSGGGYSALTQSARSKYQRERIRQMLERTIWALCEQGKRGDFLPEGAELSFSAERMSAMNIPIGDGAVMKLRGKIDRIDTMQREDGIYVRVIDYKSGQKSFDFTEMYEGLQMQLVLYIDAAEERISAQNPGKPVRPAGFFYCHIDDPIVDLEETENEEEREKMLLKAHCLSGLVNRCPEVIFGMDRTLENGKTSLVIPVALLKSGELKKSSSVADEEGFKELTAHIRKKIADFGRQMAEGEVPVRPYRYKTNTGCTYCEFRAICGFDPTLPGQTYRNLSKLTEEEIYQKIREENNAVMDKGTAEGH